MSEEDAKDRKITFKVSQDQFDALETMRQDQEYAPAMGSMIRQIVMAHVKSDGYYEGD